jgi:cytochrome b6-f complex iron-sulfur subunit
MTMRRRGSTRYVEDLIRSRRPRRFAADDDDADLARTAITLRAARPGSGAPREEFVVALRKRLAREIEPPGAAPAARQGSSGRRAFLRAATVTGGAAVAGGAALAGAGIEHALSPGGAGSAPPGPRPAQTLLPDHGAWLTVAASGELPDGAVRPFTAGAVTGFVSRADGRLRAVSGICTHQGCRLILDAPDPGTGPGTGTGRLPARLACPCHGATFAADGAVLAHRLPVTLTALPALTVREAGGAVQVYAPPAAPAG